jgi:putative endonuclease
VEGPAVRRVSRITVIFAIHADDDSVEYRYYVYILASKSRTIYIGITSDLETRVREHRSGIYGGFTSDYKVHPLVYYEQFTWVQAAISREKQLKRWRREKKVALIERDNPTWEDLSVEWGKPARLQIHAPDQ